MNKLPNPKYVTRDDGEKLGNLIISYEAMSDYQKNFLSDDTVKLYSEYFNQNQTHIVEPVSNFIKKMESLPGVDELTEDNLDELKSIVGTYDDFTAYQKTLIASDALELFGKLKTKYEELTATT